MIAGIFADYISYKMPKSNRAVVLLEIMGR